MRRPLGTLVPLALASVLVAGCGSGNDDTAQDPAASPSASPSDSPSDTPPTDEATSESPASTGGLD